MVKKEEDDSQIGPTPTAEAFAVTAKNESSDDEDVKPWVKKEEEKPVIFQQNEEEGLNIPASGEGDKADEETRAADDGTNPPGSAAKRPRLEEAGHETEVGAKDSTEPNPAEKKGDMATGEEQCENDEEEEEEEEEYDGYSSGEELKDTLGTLLDSAFDSSSAGLFAASGLLPDAPNPGLNIQGLGPLGLPLSEHEAQRIISLSVQAPFGKGTNTVVDLSVRKTWQIDASKVKFNNLAWEKYVRGPLVQMACKDLGVDAGNVEARLYKLLLYTPGGHFQKHQDTEKETGMFATLIVILPCPFLGGEFLASHQGRNKTFDTSGTSDFQTSYITFYTDVFHQVLPVTMGNRFALSFNLVFKRPTTHLPVIAPRSPVQQELLDCLKAWSRRAQRGDNAPDFVANILNYHYSVVGLESKTLKGADHAKISFLAHVADEVGLGLEFAQVEYSIWGMGEDGDMEDEEDSQFRVVDSLTLEGNKTLQTFRVTEEDITPEYNFRSDNPDKTESEGYQGNEPGTVEHWYYKTALVIWPLGDGPALSPLNTPQDASSDLPIVTQVACHLLSEKVEYLVANPTDPNAREAVKHAVTVVPKDDLSAPFLIRAAVLLEQEDVIREAIIPIPSTKAISAIDLDSWCHILEKFGDSCTRNLLEHVLNGITDCPSTESKQDALWTAWKLLDQFKLQPVAATSMSDEWIQNQRLTLLSNIDKPKPDSISSVLALCKEVGFERSKSMLEFIFPNVIGRFLSSHTTNNAGSYDSVYTFIVDLPDSFSEDQAKEWCHVQSSELLAHLSDCNEQLVPFILAVCAKNPFERVKARTEHLVKNLENKKPDPYSPFSYRSYQPHSNVHGLKLASELVSKIMSLYPENADAKAWANDHSLRLEGCKVAENLTKEDAKNLINQVKRAGFSQSKLTLETAFELIRKDLIAHPGYSRPYTYMNTATSSRDKWVLAKYIVQELGQAFTINEDSQKWVKDQYRWLATCKTDWSVTDIPFLLEVGRQLSWQFVGSQVVPKMRHMTSSYFWFALSQKLSSDSSIDRSQIVPLIKQQCKEMASTFNKSELNGVERFLQLFDIFRSINDTEGLRDLSMKLIPGNEYDLCTTSIFLEKLRPGFTSRSLSFATPPFLSVAKSILKIGSRHWNQPPPQGPAVRPLSAVGDAEIDKFLTSPVDHEFHLSANAPIRTRVEEALAPYVRNRQVSLETVKHRTPYTLVVKKLFKTGDYKPHSPLSPSDTRVWQQATNHSSVNYGRSPYSYSSISSTSNCQDCRIIQACINWSTKKTNWNTLIENIGGVDVANAILAALDAPPSATSATAQALLRDGRGSTGSCIFVDSRT